MQKKILIVGVTRNSRRKLRRSYRIFEEAFSDFERFYFIVESDSTDDTVNVLEELAMKDPHFNFVSLGILRNHLKSKSDTVAKCRNVYLEFFREKQITMDYAYLVIADWDDVNYGLKKESIDSCWAESKWDICTANQLGPYYDLWALRCTNWLDRDCHNQFNQESKVRMRRAYFQYLIKPMYKKRNPRTWIETYSSFGGLGIYKPEVVGQDIYKVDSESGCEHVLFHTAIRNRGYKIFINTSLINSNFTTNARHALYNYILLVIFGRWFSKIKQFIATFI